MGKAGREIDVTAKTRTVGIILVAATLFMPSAFAQGKKGSHAAPSTEQKPRVDEKAYKAALDRIPTPKKPYDPWGQVHDEPAKPSSK